MDVAALGDSATVPRGRQVVAFEYDDFGEMFPSTRAASRPAILAPSTTARPRAAVLPVLDICASVVIVLKSQGSATRPVLRLIVKLVSVGWVRQPPSRQPKVERPMTSSTRSSDELLEAAVALIAESGLDGLTHGAVAARAGVSRATAYREFGDKDGLVSAVGRHEVAKMVAAAFVAIDITAGAAEVVRAATLFALNYLRGHRAFNYLRMHEPGWLLTLAIAHEGTRLNLVETVAAFAEPFVAAGDEAALALPPRRAAEVVVRTVLSHALIQDSALGDEEVARTVARAVTR